MSKFNLSVEPSEEEVTKNLDLLLKLTSLKASRMLNDIGVYEILNRPRSPEEIFHMLNFNTLEEEFFRIFDLLHFQELLTKQGEFYGDNPRREYLEDTFEEELKKNSNGILSSYFSLIDKHISKYKSILKGEYGKLPEKDLILTLDSMYGSEFFYLLRGLFYNNLSQRLPLLDTKDTLTILNWGVGSGYDAIHLADYFKDRVMVLSVEPENSLHRCQVVQDIYEVYNVEFIENNQPQINQLKDCVDVFMGTTFVFMDDYKEYIKIIQSTLNEEGYLALMMESKLSFSLDWLLSIYEPYDYNIIQDDHIAKLRHYGFSRVKYIGMDKSFLLIQRT